MFLGHVTNDSKCKFKPSFNVDCHTVFNHLIGCLRLIDNNKNKSTTLCGKIIERFLVFALSCRHVSSMSLCIITHMKHAHQTKNTSATFNIEARFKFVWKIWFVWLFFFIVYFFFVHFLHMIDLFVVSYVCFNIYLIFLSILITFTWIHEFGSNLNFLHNSK